MQCRPANAKPQARGRNRRVAAYGDELSASKAPEIHGKHAGREKSYEQYSKAGKVFFDTSKGDV